MEDENLGQGGTFLLDPKTGKRKLIQQTAPAPIPDTQPEELNEGSTGKKANANSKDRE